MKHPYVAECLALIDALPALMATALEQETAVKAIIEQYSQVKSAYIVGRNLGYGVDI